LFAMVPSALLENDELTASEKIVVTALLLHRNQKSGACYPGLARISRLSSLSRMTVFRVLDSLEKKGIIERKRRFTDCGDYDTNAYSMGGWYHSDTTPYHDDTTVVSPCDYGWYHHDTLTENLNKEKEQKNPSSQSPVLEPKPKPNRAAIRAEEVQSAFSEFWNLYPKKQGKRAALAEFEKIFPADLETDRLNQRLSNLYGQLMQYVDSVQDTEAKYVKFPANWLKSIDPDEEAIIEVETWVREEAE
jgi:DNA-binding transcriptional MocR family regulator